MMTVLLILLFVSISFYDYLYMVKAKKKKVIILYSAILGVAFIMSELHILDIKVVGLNQIITFIINLFR